MTRERFVYFVKPIGQRGPIKIGCAYNPIKRIESLMVWSPQPLEVLATAPGTTRDEYEVHCRFADLHSHHEWFNPSSALETAIQQVKATGALDCIFSLPSVGCFRKLRSKGRKRHVYTADRRKYLSYSSRIRIACGRLSDAGVDAFGEPPDVQDIMERWDGRPHRGVPRITPTAAEFTRLDEFLADPAAHCVVPKWLRKEAA